jgi:hypothetical protein
MLEELCMIPVICVVPYYKDICTEEGNSLMLRSMSQCFSSKCVIYKAIITECKLSKITHKF